MHAVSRRSAVVAAVVFVFLFLSAPGGGSTRVPDRAARGSLDRVARQVSTVEPLPALVAEMTSLEVQRHVDGGTGALVLNIASAVPLEEVVVDLRLPEGITLADGGRTRSWRSDLDAGERLSLPIEVLAVRDGSFVIEAEIVGSYRGRTIRRGLAYTLDIGATRSLPRFRNGAYEYRGVAGHGGR